MPDMGKWRLRCPKPSIIDKTTSYRIDLSSHLLGKRLRRLLTSTFKKVNLPLLCPLRMPQTLLSKFAYTTICLPAPKLNRFVPVDDYVTTIAIQTFPCRTDAVSLVFTDHKVPVRSVEVGRSVVLSPLFPESLFVFVNVHKPGVPFPKLCVRNIGINPLLHNLLHI